MQKDPFFLVMYFVSLRLTFNLRPNSEVTDYCEGQNGAESNEEAYGKIVRLPIPDMKERKRVLKGCHQGK